MDLSTSDHSSERLRRLEAELEQATVCAEDAQSHVTRLTEENAALQARLRAAEAGRTATEARMQALETQLQAADLVPNSGPSATEEELRVAIEEMRVMAEELEQANAMLLAARLTVD